MSAIGVVTDSGADAEEFIGGHTGAHTTPADQEPALGAAILKRTRDRLGIIRVIVARFALGGAQIKHLISHFLDVREDILFEVEPGVIASDSHSHDFSSLGNSSIFAAKMKSFL